MFTQRKWIILLALLSLAASAQAGTLVYAVSLFGPFGTIDGTIRIRDGHSPYWGFSYFFSVFLDEFSHKTHNKAC